MSEGLQRSIYEWARSLPAWQQDLARRLAISDTLSECDLEEMQALLLRDAAAPRPQPLELEDLPSDTGAQKPVELAGLGEMRNINRLAEGQRLRFVPGLNAVYGDTGAGKSGHTRLLRRCCRAALPGEVLRDVFDTGTATGRQTARVTVRSSGVERMIEIDLAERPPRELSSVSVFDAACAHVYVSEENHVDFVPRPLVLFDRMARSQSEIAKRLAERQEEIERGAPAFDDFSAGTAASVLLGELAAPDAEHRADELSTLSDEERAELQSLVAKEGELIGTGSAELQGASERAAAALESARSTLAEALLVVDDEALTRAREIRRQISVALEAQRQLASEMLVDAPVPGTGGESWKLLYEAAREFARETNTPFPDLEDDARCGLCQQPLGEDARRRFATFERFVSNRLEERLAELRREANELQARAVQPPALRATVRAALLAIEEQEIRDLCDTALEAYTQRRAELERVLAEDAAAAAAGSPNAPGAFQAPDLAPMRAAIRARRTAAAAHAELDDEQRRRELAARLRELRDRAQLAAQLDAVRARIGELRRARAMATARKALSSGRVSHKQRELGMRAVSKELRSALKRELERLTPYPPRVTIAGSVRKGQIVVRVTLDTDPRAQGVASVLSDGEQCALSMAYFLADLSCGANRSAIVLDDPVTSLDQTRRQYVARRLAQEAAERQVIVFTHDLTFLMMLQEEARHQGIDCHGQTLLRAGGKVGVVQDGMPDDGLTARKRAGKLRGQLGALGKLHQQEEPSYKREAGEWCVGLRQAWEQTIEEIVLNGVVRRFHPTIEPNRLRHVVIDDDIKGLVEAAMRRTSPWAHNRAPALALPAPSPVELEEMAEELKALQERLDPNRRQLRAVPDVAVHGEQGQMGA